MKELLIALLLISIQSFSQEKDSLIAEVISFQHEQDEHYLNKETSPLKKKERRKFRGHDFYQIDLNYRVFATYELIENPDTIVMPTSAGTEKMFAKYAKLTFSLNGSDCVLFAYQNLKVIKMEGYENSLFVPFKDETSGTETYGGGRYLDLEQPDSEELIIDFNYAYNPYCAYTTGWFCPIPPEENTLTIEVKAGIKAPKH